MNSFWQRSRRMNVMMIQHNIEAMNANRQLNITRSSLTRSARNLSSGYKINIAADDAAGLSISEKMRRQIRGLTKATENSEDGISMVQVADGALAEVHDMLDRCIELSVQAANGTNSDADRAKIQDEIDQIVREIDAIKERTKFNEIYVLKGEVTHELQQVGTEIANEGNLPSWVKCAALDSVQGGTGVLSERYEKTYEYEKRITTTSGTSGTVTTTSITQVKVGHPAAGMDFSAYDGSAAKRADLYGMGFNTTCCTCYNYYSVEFTTGTATTVDTSQGAYVYRLGIDNINSASDLVDAVIRLTGNGNPASHYTKLEKDPNNAGKLWVYDNRSTDSQPASLTGGRWLDWKGTGAGTWNQKPNPASNRGVFGGGVMRSRAVYEQGKRHENPSQLALQVGTDAGNWMCMNMAAISSYALGIDKVDVRGCTYEERTMVDAYGSVRTQKVKVTSGADRAIRVFSAAKDIVSTNRSRLGAYQNRLEHTVGNLENIVENTTAAESQIRDTDMAKEMVQYSNKNILLQAGQSMLSQSNQSKQGILSLLAA